MVLLDILTVVGVLAFLLWLGLWISRRSSADSDGFMVGGRKLPWWLIGCSTAAEQLNTSGMLSETRRVREDGLTGLWLTWSWILMMIVQNIWFFRLFRRARFRTAMEFYHSRYAGRCADFARLYDTAVLGICVGTAWAGIGLIGMKKIGLVLFGLPESFDLLGLTVPTEPVLLVTVVVIAFSYSAASGIAGVLWTDLVQLVIAMISIYVLFFGVLADVGWNSGLRERLEEYDMATGAGILEMIPAFSVLWIFYIVLQPVLFQGGYQPAIQKMLAARSERDVVLSLIGSVFTNFVLKSVPFYILGLASLFVISDQFLLDNYAPLIGPDGVSIPDFEKAFPGLVREYLPAGMLGLMVTTFLCAFMSSFDSNIHMVGAFFSNDLYRPYIKRDGSEKHYVQVTRICMLCVTFVSVLVGLFVNNILWLIFFAVSITLAGGWVKLLRWIWWRVNGRAEVSAQIWSFFATLYILSPLGGPFIQWIVDTLGIGGIDAYFVVQTTVLAVSSTIVSLVTILLTPPEPMEVLCGFYRRVRPYGWWGPVRQALGEQDLKGDSVLAMLALTASLAAFLLGGVIFALTACLALWNIALPCLLVSSVGGLFSFRLFPKLFPKETYL